MLNLSKYQTRNQLLQAKKTGIVADVDSHKQALFNRGHEAEANIRPVADRIAGEQLYPVVGVRKDTLPLLASFDGLTMDDRIGFEHKLFNEGLAAFISDHADLPDTHWPQAEQLLYVSGAERILFMTSDGTENRCAWFWYESHPERRAALLAGWEQFAADLAAYEPVAAVAPVVAAPVRDLPVINYQLNGLALTSNLSVYRSAALQLVEDSKKPLETDQDFADCDALCKKFKDAEKGIELLKKQVLSEIADVDKFSRDLDEISGLIRQARLNGEKRVEAEKTNRKQAIVDNARERWAAHLAALNTQIGKPYMPAVVADFATAIKGLKSMESMINAVDTELSKAKIAANDVAQRIMANLKLLDQGASGYGHLFADESTLVLKDYHDLVALMTVRVDSEKQRIERVQEEERAKVETKTTERVIDQPAVAALNVPKVAVSLAPEGTVPVWQVQFDAVVAQLSGMTLSQLQSLHKYISTNYGKAA